MMKKWYIFGLSGLIVLILISLNLFTNNDYAKLFFSETNKNTIIKQSNKEISHKNPVSIYNTKSNYSDITVFWIDFRKALLSSDIDEIRKFVKFPIETRGPWDSYPIIKINKDKFERTLKAFLNQPYNDGTEYDYIKADRKINLMNYLSQVITGQESGICNFN